MSLQSVLFRVCDDVGLNRPIAPITSQTDRSSLQLLALLTAAAEDLMKDWAWQALIRAATITTISGQQAYALPVDFERMIDETEWYTSAKVPLFGPMNQKDFAQNQYGLINVGPYFRFQILQNQVFLQPTPNSNGQTINYYYASGYWVIQNATGTPVPAATFSGDTDTFYLDENLLFLGVRWRWKRAKGLAYDEERDQFDRFAYQARGDDRGARQLSMDPAAEPFDRQTGFIVPISGFGQ